MIHSISSSCRKLFLPRHHLWYRPLNSAQRDTSPSRAWSFEIGITQRGLDDIGDVSSVLTNCQVGSVVTQGQELLKLQWDAHVITSADELYHAVWENVSGAHKICSPVDGVIERIQTSTAVDDNEALVTISTTHDSLHAAIQHLVDEDVYHRLISTQPPGRFAEAD